MTLHAAEASELLLSTAERGGTAVGVVAVGGSLQDVVGRRLVLVRPEARADGEVTGSLGSEALDQAAIAAMQESLADPRAGDGLLHVEVDSDSVELYLEIRRPIQDLIVVGAGHIAQPLSRMGATLGFRVTVLDDRPDFATRERFPEAYRVIEANFSNPFEQVQIHERSHILLVTRGHKYDYECLIRALRMDPLPAYIGMIGSRRRVRATYVQLLDDGVEAQLLERIHAPVGLDIGAETPEEIAVSVAAELVMVRRGGSGTSLREVERVAERFFGSSTEEAQE